VDKKQQKSIIKTSRSGLFVAFFLCILMATSLLVTRKTTWVTILSVALFAFVLECGFELILPKIRSAYLITALQVLLLGYWAFPMLIMSYSLAANYSILTKTTLILSVATSALIGVLINLKRNIDKLEKAQEINVRSRKIDLRNGTYDFSIPIHFTDPEIEKAQTS